MSLEFKKDLQRINSLYYREKLSIRMVAERCGVTVNALTYFMRKYDLKRRSPSENSKITFNKKPLSFKEKSVAERNKELVALGVALYWAEGYKAEKASGLDFANSDPALIKAFLNFLRTLFILDESRLRVYHYCHSKEQIPQQIAFWSEITAIPKNQFLKSYIQQKSSKSGRIMKYGLIHVRYNDKKLLVRMRELISEYQARFGKL